MHRCESMCITITPETWNGFCGVHGGKRKASIWCLSVCTVFFPTVMRLLGRILLAAAPAAKRPAYVSAPLSETFSSRLVVLLNIHIHDQLIAMSSRGLRTKQTCLFLKDLRRTHAVSCHYVSIISEYCPTSSAHDNGL